MHDDKDSLITRTIGIYGSNSYAQSLQSIYNQQHSEYMVIHDEYGQIISLLYSNFDIVPNKYQTVPF